MAGDTDCRYSKCDGSLGISSVVRLRENEVDNQATKLHEAKKRFCRQPGGYGK